MSNRLSREELVTIQVLDQKGHSASAIARDLGVTEGAVRYRLKRAAQGATDGRGNKVFKAAEHAEAIEAFLEGRRRVERPANVDEVYDFLVKERGYKHSYKSVLRYMRAKYGLPAIRTYRRVETPPGAQTQTDWGEFPRVSIRREVVALHAFVMVLSHSRKPAVGRTICPATGTTVAQAWEAERALLRPLPALLPEPFDVVVTRPVYCDCTVHFEGRQYMVPFTCVGRHVEVHGCASTVQILFEGKVIREYRLRDLEQAAVSRT